MIIKIQIKDQNEIKNDKNNKGENGVNTGVTLRPVIDKRKKFYNIFL